MLSDPVRGIVEAVRIIQEHGGETCESCKGGVGRLSCVMSVLFFFDTLLPFHPIHHWDSREVKPRRACYRRSVCHTVFLLDQHYMDKGNYRDNAQETL